MSMSNVLTLVISLSLSGTILAALTLAIKPFIMHRFSKSTQYAVWIVIFLRLLLPFSFESSVMNHLFYGDSTEWFNASQGTADNSDWLQTNIAGNRMNNNSSDKDGSNGINSPEVGDSSEILAHTGQGSSDTPGKAVENNIGNAGSNIGNVGNTALNSTIASVIDSSSLANSSSASSLAVKRNFSLLWNKAVPFLFVIWLLGAILTFTANINGYNRFLRQIKKTNRDAVEEEKQILAVLLKSHVCAVQRSVSFVRNPYVAAPMTFGILKPCIILPDHPFSSKQVQNILFHELVHVKRFDVAVKWLAVLASSVHWFNPFLIWMRKEINHACELACDEAVVQNFSNQEKQDYGETLISIVSAGRYPLGILQATMYEDKKTLKDRLTAIMKHGKKSKLIPVLSGILLLTIVLGAMALGAGIGIGADKPPKKFVDTPLYDLDDIAKYRTQYIGDNSKISALVSRLPVPVNGFSQRYISLDTAEKPYGLTVFYESISDNGDGQVWPIPQRTVTEEISRKNALVLFCMVDNLDSVTFAYRNSPSGGKLDSSAYEKVFLFQRASLEEEYGSLSVLRDNLDFLHGKLLQETDLSNADNDQSSSGADNEASNATLINSTGSSVVNSLPYEELVAHSSSMEELLDNSQFTDMPADKMDSILSMLPDLIRQNYGGIGRLEQTANEGTESCNGYVILTCKPGGTALPDGTTMYLFSPGGTMQEQTVLEDKEGKEICRFSLSLNVRYYSKEDLFLILIEGGQLSGQSIGTKQIEQLAGFQFTGDTGYMEYERQAKLRGSTILQPQPYPYISVDIFLNSRRWTEHITLETAQVQEIKNKLANLNPVNIDTSKIKNSGVSICFGEEEQYMLCFLEDGTKVLVNWKDFRTAFADPQLVDSLLDTVERKTKWEWTELSEIHDLTRAEMRMKLGQDSKTEIQVVEDTETLKELEELFSKAEYIGITKCPFSAQMLLTRSDGKTFTIHIATDSCDSMILGTSAGYDYGPHSKNKQEVLTRIFKEVNWAR
jgi:beta-lactamase regulating signal transducer with metallopeptidase domain